MALCLYVTSRCSIEMDELIELVFVMAASFQLSCTVSKGNSGPTKLRAFPSENLSQTLNLENFASAYRSLKCVIHLARQRGCSESDKLDWCQSTKLTVPLTSDTQLLVYHSNHKALSATRFRRVGLLAADDTHIS